MAARVVLEVLHEGRGQFVGGELRGDAGLVEFEDECVPGGEERGLARAVGRAEFVGEAGFVRINRTRSAGDVLQVETERIEQDFLCGRGAAALLRLFRVEVFDDLRDGCEVACGLAACGEVGGVVFSKCLDAAKHVVTAGFSVVHGVFCIGEFWGAGWTRGNWRGALFLPSGKWRVQPVTCRRARIKRNSARRCISASGC